MSSKPAAIPLFGDAYMADTRHLSLEEHGAYLMLLMIAWRTEDCSLPNDDKRLARMLGIGSSKWAKLKPSILAFWTLVGDTWTQNRLSKERAYVAARSKVQAENGAAKWTGPPQSGDERDNAKKRSQRLSEARQKGRHTQEQWAWLLDLMGNKCVRCEAGGPLCKDHITPIYMGGSDAIGNLQPLCVSCNSSKTSDTTDYRLNHCKDLIERLPNVSQTPPPSPSPPQDKVPLANANGGQAANLTAADVTKSVWDTGKAILKAAGHDDRQAGSIIGRFRKTYSDSQVLIVLSRCQIEQPSEPLEWLTKALEFENGRSRNTDNIASLRGPRPNSALDMVLEAERELQAEAQRENPGHDWPPRLALPSH